MVKTMNVLANRKGATWVLVGAGAMAQVRLQEGWWVSGIGGLEGEARSQRTKSGPGEVPPQAGRGGLGGALPAWAVPLWPPSSVSSVQGLWSQHPE